MGKSNGDASMTDNVGTKTKKISYFDPKLGRKVEREVRKPLSCGATVEEIGSMEELQKKWNESLVLDLSSPLASHGRGILQSEILKTITDETERAAITDLCATHHFNDDRLLKLIGRILTESNSGEDKMVSAVQTEHERAIWKQALENLKIENKALVEDVKKLYNSQPSKTRSDKLACEARDEARVVRGQLSDAQAKFSRLNTQFQTHVNVTAVTAATLRKEVGTLRKERDSLALRRNDHPDVIDQIATLSIQKDDLIKEKRAIAVERDALKRDAQRNIENALTEYETEVMGKLASVAEARIDNVNEVSILTAEVNSLTLTIEKLQDANAGLGRQIHQINNIATKERSTMNDEAETTFNENDIEVLRCRDIVYTQVSGEGPFVLITQVEEALVEYSNPISNRKNAFNCGKLPITDAWLVRCKDGTMRTFPAPALTKVLPKSSMSFGGVKRLITSDVTAKLFQAAIWISMLTLLFQQ